MQLIIVFNRRVLASSVDILLGFKNAQVNKPSDAKTQIICVH